MTLRLFLDSADPSDWEAWLPSGLFFGITTNPSLLKKAGQPCDLDHLRQLSRRALELGPRNCICRPGAAAPPNWCAVALPCMPLHQTRSS